MSVAGKTQILVNTTTIGDGDSIAAYLVDSLGNFLTSQTIETVRRLNVNSASEWAEDSAHATGNFGSFVLAVRNDTPGSLVDTDGDYAPLQVDSTGALRVAASVTIAGTFAEDSAHTSGHTGMFVLGVRQDTTAATAGTNGDYTMLQTWSNGELKTVDVANLSNLQQVIAVGTTAVALPTTALTLRKNMFIQNISAAGHILYLGSATVTNSGATRGLRLAGGGYVNVDAGPAQAIFGIASASGCDVVVWEFS